MPQTRIGISGWTYPPWRRVFYPDGLPQRRELEFASRQVGSIEINGTFYALQQPDSFRGWAEQTPDEFVFSVKGGRFITHLKKLRDVDTALANFLASGVLALGPKLGPLLWQLPPNLGYDAERVEAFLSLLPRTTPEAAELAAQHDERVADRAWITTDADRPVRHAIEVRHASYETPSFFRTAACVRGRGRHRRHRRQVAADRGADGGLSLSAAAWRRGALFERLLRRSAGRVGGQGARVGTGPRRLRLLRQRRQGAGAV
jgi:uncharacterized protein YecE (DUF72 family)